MTWTAALLFASLVQAPSPKAPNELRRIDRVAGWMPLFDGETGHGWRSIGKDTFPTQGWTIDDGCLHLAAAVRGGDLVYDGAYLDFEFAFEWKIAEATNSGVKYRVMETPGAGAMLGFEYQLLDDPRHPQTAAKHTTASLYDLEPPAAKVFRPAGEFNRSRILVHRGRIEHWLNGTRVIDLSTDTDEFRDKLARSKFAKVVDFARAAGPVGLQDHGGEVWFQNLWLRDLTHLEMNGASFARGMSLRSWRTEGAASRVEAEDRIVTALAGGDATLAPRCEGNYICFTDLQFGADTGVTLQLRDGVELPLDAPPADGWHRYFVECIGPRVRVRRDGLPLHDETRESNLDGALVFRLNGPGGSEVRLRDPALLMLGGY